MTTPILAGAPGECCFTAVKHEGTPAGRIDTITGVPTYVSEPKSPKTTPKPKVVLFFADIYGPLYINNELVQDYFSSQGFFVVGVDYFLGDPVYIHTEPDFDRPAWIEKSKQQAKELMPPWMAAIREKYGQDAQYAAVGYCFGGPFVLDLAARGDIVAGAIAHPAFLTEDHFKNINKPLFLSCAEIDHTFPLESRRRAEDILIERKTGYCFQVFSGVKHGFALRGDPNVGDTRWAKEESARGIANWFQRFYAEDLQLAKSEL
ncbi:alpha/beta-hydrolase [Guyanagaster necrorhizus]|uniref:Alpha/beta-hydrolase n=1 Tax=Guyanagaster necrorhizus TaxID=856835 RepID=A0A9P8ALP6_9AGAR|nr:alpha/beta-hydrolase [Guyanagaster necrorhizus MCA 3950]KAG7439924.1 alpha/beta-hydrolase [Guyanagaster necrorhizus MCA 3950]